MCQSGVWLRIIPSLPAHSVQKLKTGTSVTCRECLHAEASRQCIYVFVYVYIDICMYVNCMYVCMYVCVYVCM